jgi:hypothetical protein
LAVLPARPGKPKDKAKVETHVNVLYKQVYARLRNRTFHSLEERKPPTNYILQIFGRSC